MNRNKKGKNRKLFKKKSHSNNRLGCIIAIIVLIPILFGVYLYCQQINIQKNNEPQTDTSFQIPPGKDLETPISLVPRQEQIIRHSGYTVSYNKDLKIPNWVSYELTRKETKGNWGRGTVQAALRGTSVAFAGGTGSSAVCLCKEGELSERSGTSWGGDGAVQAFSSGRVQ